MAVRAAGGFLVGEEGLGRRRAPQVRGDVPVVGHPAVVDLVDVGEPLDPRAPRIGVVVEEVGSDGVTAQAPARFAALGAHSVGADRDRVDGRDLEAGVVEAAVGAGDEPEDVMVARPGVQERHHVVVDRVADPQPEHLGVELGHPCGLRGEQQRVPEALREHVPGRVGPLRDADPLAAAAHVDQHLGGRPGRSLGLVEQLHGGTVGVPKPQALFGGAGRRLDDGRAGPLKRLADRVHGARAERERDVVQPLGRRLDQPHLLLIAAWAHRDQRPVLLPGFQAEVLKEALGHGQVRHF